MTKSKGSRKPSVGQLTEMRQQHYCKRLGFTGQTVQQRLDVFIFSTSQHSASLTAPQSLLVSETCHQTEL